MVPRVAPHVVASTEPTTSAATDADACYGHRDSQQETKDEESHDSLSPVQGLQTGGARPAGGRKEVMYWTKLGTFKRQYTYKQFIILSGYTLDIR